MAVKEKCTKQCGGAGNAVSEVNKVRAVPKGLANTSQAKRKAEGLGYDDDGSQSTEAS